MGSAARAAAANEKRKVKSEKWNAENRSFTFLLPFRLKNGIQKSICRVLKIDCP
jgi:hypothetical protein